MTWSTADRNRASHGRAYVPYDPETNAKPATSIRVEAALEALEDEFLFVVWNPDSIVAHDEFRNVIVGLHQDMDGTPRTKPNGIRDKISAHLVDTEPVPPSRGR